MKPKLGIWTAIIFFAFASTASLLSHFNFQTNAFDLGIFTETVNSFKNWDFLGINTVREKPALGDHFSPILILVAVFSKILFFIPTPVFLLIFQAFIISFGGFGIYKLAKTKFSDFSAFLFQFFFYTFVGIQSAINFDFHSIVISVGIFPWLFLALFSEKINWKILIPSFLIILLTKEDQGILLFTLFLSLGVFRQDHRKVFFLLSFASLTYSMVVIKYIVPAINSNYGYQKFYDAEIGLGFGLDLVLNLGEYLQKMVDSPLKVETLIYLIISGGIFALFSPELLLSIFFLVLEKHLTKNHAAWGLSFHYGAIFAPFITVAMFRFFDKARGIKIPQVAKQSVVYASFFYIIFINFVFFNSPLLSKLINNVNMIFDSDSVSAWSANPELFSCVKKGETVSVQSSLVPHFSERNKVYLFPNGIEESEYIIVSSESEEKASYFWPLAPHERDSYIGLIIQNPKWDVECIVENHTVFKKIQNRNE